MKNLTSFVSKFLVASSLMVLGFIPAQAQNNIYWKAGATGGMNTSTNWSSNANGIGGTVSSTNFPKGSNAPTTATFIATFSATSESGSTNIAATLPASTYATWFDGSPVTAASEWGSIDVLGSQTGSVTITGTTSGSDLVLGSGAVTSGVANMILVNSGAGAVTIGSTTAANAVTIDGASNTPNVATSLSITNNSSNKLTIVNTLTLHASGTGNTTTLLLNGTGETDFSSGISNGANNITALTVGTGSGSTTSAVLNGATTFTAATTINGGKLTLGANGALADTGSVLVENGGSLAFGSSAITTGLNTAANVTLSGGSIVMNGASQTIGTLTLAAGTTDIINLTGGGHLTLTNITWNAGAQLEIIGWSGTSAAGSTTTQIFLGKIGGDTGESTWASNEANISWSNVTLNGVTGDINNDADVFHVGGNTYQGIPAGVPVAPAPEPSTIVIGLGLLGLLVWGGRQQLIETGRRLALVRA